VRTPYWLGANRTVPADPPHAADGPPRRGRRALATGLITAMMGAAAALAAPTALAAVPLFPDNILVFPNRDFVSIDGYADHAGQPITVEVNRPGVGLVGSATGTVASAAAIAAGNPAIEVNHPGGICWGAGGGLSVTPDIVTGDVVTVKFGATVAGDTTSGDAEVTGSVVNGNTLTVQGHVGPTVNPAFLEQRIINPDLVGDPSVAKRSVAAVPGPLVQSPKGNYQSGLTVTGTTFTATYVFDNPTTATTAGAGDMRAMSWQDQDAAGNRQGLTIAEFGTGGGPGMGGCPSAPAQTVAASPTNVTAVQNGADVAVTWTPVAQIPGTAPVIGYTVRAVDSISTNGAQNEIGKRTSDLAATSMSLPTTLAGKRIEVRVLTEAGESWPPGIPGGGPNTDTTIPTVSATPAGGTYTADQVVTLAANEPGSQIVYTIDGTDPLTAADAGSTALIYTAPITIVRNDTTPVVLRYVAFDPAGNASLAKSETYRFGAPSAPGAPTVNSVTAGNTTADVRWTAPANAGTSPITGYTVTATPPAPGAPVTVSTVASATTASLTGLTNGTTYAVTVGATNAVGTTTSAPVNVTPVAPATEQIAVTSAVWKAGDFRISGTGSVTGATISVRTGGFAGPIAAQATVAAPVAPAVNGTWTIRIRTGPLATTKPAQIWVTSSGGGQTGPVTVN
jgi:Chitobiase/beta-hexosaminidase C-terminal domain/Fibronectin type III domain